MRTRRRAAAGLPLIFVTLLVGAARSSPIAPGRTGGWYYGTRALSSSRSTKSSPPSTSWSRASAQPSAQYVPWLRGGPPLAIIPFAQWGRAYNQWLLRKPFMSNLISGTSMVILGDVISQVIEEKAKSSMDRFKALFHLDSRRLFNTGIAGVVFNGLLLPQWYVLIHKWMPVETPRTIAVKIACNCVAWGLAGNGLAMLMRRVLEGEKWDTAVAEVRRDLPGVVANDYKIWPLYDVLCFTVIPRHFQAVSTGVLGVAWCTYISLVVHEKHDDGSTKPSAPSSAAAASGR